MSRTASIRRTSPERTVVGLLEAAYPNRAQAVLGAYTLVSGWAEWDPLVAERVVAEDPEAGYEDAHGLFGFIRGRMLWRARKKASTAKHRRRRKRQRQARRRQRQVG